MENHTLQGLRAGRNLTDWIMTGGPHPQNDLQRVFVLLWEKNAGWDYLDSHRTPESTAVEFVRGDYRVFVVFDNATRSMLVAEATDNGSFVGFTRTVSGLIDITDDLR